MPNYRLLAISGSLRKGSYNTSLTNAFVAHAPEGTMIEVLDWSNVPIFNQDEETPYPAPMQAIKDKIRAADGVIIATPEYNRSIPGPLKNLLDWMNRPYPETAWAGKPIFVVGASTGHVGTALAQYDVKKVMLFNNAFVMGQPEFYLVSAADKFDATGTLIDEDTKEHITRHLGAFLAYIEKLR